MLCAKAEHSIQNTAYSLRDTLHWCAIGLLRPCLTIWKQATKGLGTLDATALGYWQAIRSRAGISTDIDATIAATEMDKEAENDWGLIPVESYLLTRHCITSVANGGVKCWPKLCATWMSAVGEQWIN